MQKITSSMVVGTNIVYMPRTFISISISENLMAAVASDGTAWERTRVESGWSPWWRIDDLPQEKP